MAIRAVLFDHDGTLVDSYEGIARCMALTCRELGMPEMGDEEILASIGPPLEARFAELWGEDISEKATAVYRSHYDHHFLSGTRLLPGVKETLDAISEKGISIACVSNKKWTYCVRQLEHFGLMERIDVVLGAQQGLPPKPDPAMLHAALEKLGALPGEAAMVGDTPIDIAAARAAGVRAWAIWGKYAPREDIERARPDIFLDQITKVLDFL